MMEKGINMTNKTTINAEQLVLIQAALHGYETMINIADKGKPFGGFPGISRIRSAAELSFVLELMEILDLECDDTIRMWQAD